MGESGEDLDDVVEGIFSGEGSVEDLEDVDSDKVEKVSREEAIDRMCETAEMNPAMDITSVGNPLGHGLFEAASVAVDEYERLIENYGAPIGVLYVPNGTPADVVDEVHGQISTDVSTRPETEEIILLGNDQYIDNYQDNLEECGFRFVDDWREPESDYRKLVSIAEEVGTEYKIEEADDGWTYIEIEEFRISTFQGK